MVPGSRLLKFNSKLCWQDESNDVRIGDVVQMTKCLIRELAIPGSPIQGIRGKSRTKVNKLTPAPIHPLISLFQIRPLSHTLKPAGFNREIIIIKTQIQTRRRYLRLFYCPCGAMPGSRLLKFNSKLCWQDED